jgi:hypothetical protein
VQRGSGTGNGTNEGQTQRHNVDWWCEWRREWRQGSVEVFGRGNGEQKDDTATVGWKGFLPSSPTRPLRRHMRASPQTRPSHQADQDSASAQGSGGPGKKKCHRDLLSGGEWESAAQAGPKRQDLALFQCGQRRRRRTPAIDVMGFRCGDRCDIEGMRRAARTRLSGCVSRLPGVARVGHNHLELLLEYHDSRAGNRHQLPRRSAAGWVCRSGNSTLQLEGTQGTESATAGCSRTVLSYASSRLRVEHTVQNVLFAYLLHMDELGPKLLLHHDCSVLHLLLAHARTCTLHLQNAL